MGDGSHFLVENADAEQQTPGSQNLRRTGNYVLRSDPMEGSSSCVFATPDTRHPAHPPGIAGPFRTYLRCLRANQSVVSQGSGLIWSGSRWPRYTPRICTASSPSAYPTWHQSMASTYASPAEKDFLPRLP